MTLKECYQILNVDQSASLEEVKRAYRRRAFELHPDLNPDISDANRQFQRLNEAYVILNRLVAAREAAAKEAAAKGPAGQEAPRPGPRWYDWGFSFGGKKDDAAEAASNEERQAQREERRAQREEAYREEIRREEARQRERKREEERRQEERRKTFERERAERLERERKQAEQATSEQAKPEQTRAEQARPEHVRPEQARPEQARTEQPRPEQPRPDRPQAERPHAAKAPSGDNMYAEQQEVLRDILNDDFARRVFEDIYSEIRKKTPPPGREERRVKREEPSRSQTMQAESVPQKAKSGLPFGLDQFKLDFSSGVGNTVKGWLRSQIDEEQTIRLPATGLYPGARVRLQIRRGLSEELTTLEVTLPPDFVAGKPVRLRGMGKKLGSMQGDLYLTVLAR